MRKRVNTEKIYDKKQDKKQKKENHKNNKEDFNDRKNGTLLSMEQIQYFVNLKPILMKGYE